MPETNGRRVMNKKKTNEPEPWKCSRCGKILLEIEWKDHGLCEYCAYYDDFTRYSESGLSWHNKAWHLMGAAGALWACQNNDRSKEIVGELGLETEFSMGQALGEPYLMLCGLSLELLFKAIVVAKRGKPMKHHNLRALATNASVELTEKQKGQLDFLSEYVTWAGRYPVSKERDAFNKLPKLRFEHLLLYEKLPGSSFVKMRAGSQLDWHQFHTLWRHIETIYWQHHQRHI
jgi:hypothetical protein